MARTTIRGAQVRDDSIELGTDTSGVLPINEGGTNATTAADARTNLGLVIGTHVQAYNANTTTLGNTTTGSGSIVLATSPALTTPTGIVKGDVGLGNVDNTSDATKNSATATLTNKRINPRVVTLTDGATVAVNSDTTDIGNLSMAGDRTLLAPSGTPVDGQKLQIRLLASGAGRTLTLTTGSAGSYAFGSDITALSQTVSGKYDYLGFVYNSTSDRWHLLAYSKGY